MKPTVIHNPNSGNNINNCSDPNANNNPDIQPQQQQQQVPQQHPQQQIPQGIYDNGLAGGANSRRFPFYPSGFDFFDDDELFPEGGVRSRLNRMRDPFGTWGRKRRNSQEHVTPQQTAQAGAVPQSQQIPPQPDEGYEDDFFPQMQPGWGADSAFGRGSRKRNPNLDDDDDFFSYIPQQFRQYIPSNFQFPRMRSHFGRQQVPQPAAASSPQNRNYFPQQQQPQQQSPPQQQQQENRPKFCDAAMQTDADLLAQSQGQGDQPNLNQHGLRNTIDMGQKANDEVDDAGPRARSAPPDHNQNDPNNPNNFASAQSFSSATGFPGQKPQVYAQATATPGAHAQAHAQAQTSNMGTNTGPGTPNGSNIYRQYYYPFDNNAPPPSSPPRQQQQQQYQQPSTTPQTPNQEGQFIRTVPIVVESRKVPAKPKPQPQQQQQQPQQQTQQAPSQAHPQAQQRQPQQNSQPREIPIRVEHATTQNQAPAAQSPPPPQQATEPEEPKAQVTPPDSITKIQAIQKEVMELMLAVEQFKGNGRDKDYMYLDEMLTRNLIKLDDIETDGKENIRLARKEAIKCIQASLCVLEMKADGHIPPSERKPDDAENKQGAAPQASEATDSEAIAQEKKSPDDSTKTTADQEKTENVTDKKGGVKAETINTSTTNDNQGTPPPEKKESTSVENKENEPENKVESATKPAEAEKKAAVDETKPAAEAVATDMAAEVKPTEST